MTSHDVKLVATDLDGTLLGADATISTRTADTLRAAADAGVEVVAITGRSHWSAVPLLRHLGAIRWVVCSNGASLYDLLADEVVDRRLLSGAEVDAVVESVTGKFRRVGFSWETVEGLFHSRTWIACRSSSEDGSISVSNSVLVAQDRPAGGGILKLLLAHDRLTAYDWLEALVPHVPFGLTASTSGASFVEITAGDANKGAALDRVCRMLGIDRAATVAFGDNANDIDMLAWAGRSFAMANAHELARAAADASAPHHADDGVARVLEDLLGLA